MQNATHKMYLTLRRTCLIALLTCSQGCIVMPTDYVFAEENTIIEDKTLKFIQEGQTSKDEIERALGSPGFIFDDGSRWIYVKGTKKSGGMIICAGIILDATGSSKKCSRPDRDLKWKILDLHFDSTDNVENQQHSSVRAGSCTKSNICLDGGGTSLTIDGVTGAVWMTQLPEATAEKIVSASDGSQAEASDGSQAEARPDQCTVHIYTKGGDIDLKLLIDSTDLFEHFLASNKSLQLELDQGEHSIDVLFNDGFIEEIQLDCVDNFDYYLRVHKEPGVHSATLR